MTNSRSSFCFVGAFVRNFSCSLTSGPENAQGLAVSEVGLFRPLELLGAPSALFLNGKQHVLSQWVCSDVSKLLGPLSHPLAVRKEKSAAIEEATRII